MATPNKLSLAEMRELNKGLYYAYECNDMEKVEELVSGFKDKKYAINNSLYHACWWSNEDAVQNLLTNQLIDPQWSNPIKDSGSCLHGAALRGNTVIVQTLLNNNWNIHTVDKYGYTPMHDAASAGHEATVELLIKSGGNIDSTNNDGNTPMHIAAYRGFKSTVELLIKSGGNIHSPNNHGKTPAHYSKDVRTVQKTIDLQVKEEEKQKKDDMKKFMTACENNGVINIKPLKCVLTGPPLVGKTSFLHRVQKKNITQIDSQGQHMKMIPSSGFECPVTINIKENAININEEATTITAAAINKGQWVTAKDVVEQGHLLLQQSVKRPVLFNEESTKVLSSQHQQPSSIPKSTQPKPKPSISPLDRLTQIFRSKSKKLEPTCQFMQKVLNSSGMQKLEDLEEMTTVYFMDTGGQPEFHELLPPLLRGPALHLIFFNASHDLNRPVKVWFRHEDENSPSVEYESSSSSIEMIHQLLSSFYCLSLEDNSKQTVSVLLGSYIDQLSPNRAERSKQIMDVSSVVLEHIGKTEFYKNGFVTFPKIEGEHNPIFLPLDNATASKEEIEGIQTFLLQIIKDNFPSVPLPVTWAVFHLILRYKYEESPGVCTLAECTDLAVDCGIQAEDLTAILRWFHENLGTVLYYEEVESLKEFVICNPDVLFSGISRLVTISFATSGDRHTAAEEIRKTGEIPEHVLPKATPLISQCPLNNQHLIDLLTHFKLITQFGDDAKPSLFMPCLLLPDPNVLYSLTSEKVANIFPPPLLLSFKGAFIPVGVFSALMVELSKKWKLDPANRYRNRATFFCGLSHIEIRSCLAFIEVRLTGSHAITKICTSVRKAVVDCLNAVLRVQPHISISTVKFFIGFYCPGCFLPCTPVALHPCECLCEDDDFNRTLLCNNEPQCDGFNEAFQVSPEQNVWFEDSSSSTSHTIVNTDLTGIKPGVTYCSLEQKPPEVTDVFHLIKDDISASWFDVGEELGISLNDRQTLMRDVSLSNNNRLESVLVIWVQQEKKDVKWVVILEALKALQRKDLVRKVIKFLEEPETYSKYNVMDDFSPL